MPTQQALRTAQDDLTALADRELLAIWASLETATQARDAMRDTLPALIEAFGLAASAMAADWYDDLRLELDVPGRFTAIPAEIPDIGADALAGWGTEPLFEPRQDWDAALGRISGGMQRRIVNHSRETIRDSTLKDPTTRGWQRVGSGDSCDFCRLLIGRGAVYKEATVDFAAHDNCNCAVVPKWSPAVAKQVKDYTPSRKRSTEASRAALRAYIASST